MIIRIYRENPNPRSIRQVVDCLRDGGVIIYPTDTVYGIGCDIFNPKAVERVKQIKGLKGDKVNLSFICHDLSQLSDYAKPIPNSIFKLMRSVLPGPYTFILEASNNVPKIFKNKKKTVGIRIPDCDIIRKIVEELGNPIMSTSVHDEDEIIEYTTDPELIHEKYNQVVDLVIDAGYGDNTASTILDCTRGEVEVIRQGKGEI
ncbi:MAG: threonylcarbamoyl-AMP synthase [Bacteroidia bacterium]|nr:L-threonylcarbamoyladenylate synthase [Bacteroidales bacterium]NCD41674.1 threonylcarbamoyl-AMP synthase [Bacteroidia bacterium]HPE87733.1 L-threonylcarbamoyladenylate synthase [Bacteroidales bacterium]